MLRDSSVSFNELHDQLDSERNSSDGTESDVAVVKDESISILAVRLSWAANITLLVAKGVVFILTFSVVILQAFLDSVTDICSQSFLAYAEVEMANPEVRYPAGKGKLETLAVIYFSWFQIFLQFASFIFAGITVYIAVTTELPDIEGTVVVYVFLLTAVALKIALYFYCRFAMNHTKNKDLMWALATDHLNDVQINSAAVVFLVIADTTPLWWADPGGATLIGFYIMYTWSLALKEHTNLLTGESAPEDFILELQDQVRTVLVNLGIEFIGFNRFIAYYSGNRYIVEVEIAFDQHTSSEKANEAINTIVDLLESYEEEVERAYVFAEFSLRAQYVHRVDRDYFSVDPKRRVLGLPRLSIGGLINRKLQNSK